MPIMRRGGAVKRKRAEKVRDLARIAELHDQRKTITEIAQALNLSRGQVFYDLKELEKQWRADGVMDMHRAKMRQLRELRKVRDEALAAWEKSKLGESETTQDIRVQVDKDGNRVSGGKIQPARVTTRKKASVGEAKFLDVILKTISDEADLLGTKINKLELDTPSGAVEAGLGGVILLPLGPGPNRPTKENGGMK